MGVIDSTGRTPIEEKKGGRARDPIFREGRIRSISTGGEGGSWKQGVLEKFQTGRRT